MATQIPLIGSSGRAIGPEICIMDDFNQKLPGIRRHLRLLGLYKNILISTWDCIPTQLITSKSVSQTARRAPSWFVAVLQWSLTRLFLTALIIWDWHPLSSSGSNPGNYTSPNKSHLVIFSLHIIIIVCFHQDLFCLGQRGCQRRSVHQWYVYYMCIIRMFGRLVRRLSG